jgi:ornithine cyclodeaminase/alanine dehydrogenase-like protein (mu-crystallin family)
MGRPGELDESVFNRAKQIVIGCRDHEENHSKVEKQSKHTLLNMIKDGKITWDQVNELGEFIVGKIPSNEQQITVFKESQGGFGDVAIANYVYMKAKENGLGVEIEM